MSFYKFPPNTYRELPEQLIRMKERRLGMKGLQRYKPPSPPPPMRTNPVVVQRCFGHHEEMVTLSRGLNVMSQLICSWGRDVTVQPWADVCSFSAPYTDERYRLKIEEFQYETPLMGGRDLARLAAAIPEAADSIVTDIEGIVYSDHPNSLCGRPAE